MQRLEVQQGLRSPWLPGRAAASIDKAAPRPRSNRSTINYDQRLLSLLGSRAQRAPTRRAEINRLRYHRTFGCIWYATTCRAREIKGSCSCIYRRRHTTRRALTKFSRIKWHGSVGPVLFWPLNTERLSCSRASGVQLTLAGSSQVRASSPVAL